jgi:hypothetical protein
MYSQILGKIALQLFDGKVKNVLSFDAWLEICALDKLFYTIIR